MADYELKPALSGASLGDYVALFEAAFGKDSKLTEAYLQWQYLDNPDGRVIGTDAFLNGELAAHYAIIPRRYRWNARSFRAALSVNTATHPDHQGKGLFTRLANATYEAAAAGGVQFVVGAANANSVGGFIRKLGFQSLGQIRLYAALSAPRASPDSLDLDLTPEWINWRFGNPARRYSRLPHGDGTTTISTWVKATPFHVSRIGNQEGALLQLGASPPVLPALTPLFAPERPRLPRLPLKAQPSPWHVIWRSLDPSINDSMAANLRYDGLSMDTF